MSYLSLHEDCVGFRSTPFSMLRENGGATRPYSVPADMRLKGSPLVMDVVAEYGRRYLDIRYDFNFKHVFGKDESQLLRTDLLNSLFDGRKRFTRVRLGPTEHQGLQERSRTARYDLQCTGDQGEQILIEMQREHQDNFFKRLGFYGLRLGSEQIPAGKEGDNFPLPDIYAIAILDFDIWQGMEHPVELQDKYINCYGLRHIKTCHGYPINLELVLVELRKFHKGIDELDSRADQWLYLFKNLHHLKEPVFTADPIFQKLFQLTEYNKLKTEDGQMIIDRERDMRNIQRSWEQQGIEKGMKKGLAKGRLEASKQEKLLFARKLIRRTNFNDREVASLAGVDEECVRDLRARI